MLLRSLDLFSGIGGFAYALRDVARPVAYCEIDPHACRVLAARMAEGTLPTAPVAPDVAALDAAWLRDRAGLDVPGGLELLTGGFPCRPSDPTVRGTCARVRASVPSVSAPASPVAPATRIRGARAAHVQSGLFAHIVRLVRDVRPQLFLLGTDRQIEVGV